MRQADTIITAAPTELMHMTPPERPSGHRVLCFLIGVGLVLLDLAMAGIVRDIWHW